MLSRARIAVLVSGGGTNLQALLDARQAGKLPHGEIALVVSSKEGAYALERAEKACVPGATIHHMPFPVTPDMVYNALLAADAMGRAWHRREERK